MTCNTMFASDAIFLQRRYNLYKLYKAVKYTQIEYFKSVRLSA